MDAFSKAVEKLNNEPSEANWKRFEAALHRSKAKFYRIVYAHGSLKNAEDLTKSYAELYDAGKKLVAKVPIFEKTNGKVEGATRHLKGLTNIPVIK
ncbi:MAG: hypothetical protein ACP5T3_03405 [Candidatus Micrarchaeia archaeon]